MKYVSFNEKTQAIEIRRGPGLGAPYCVPLDRCRTASECLDWIHQLHEKSWFNNSVRESEFISMLFNHIPTDLWSGAGFGLTSDSRDREAARDLSKRLEKAQKEIARLKTVPMKYRRMEFNAQLQKENKDLHNKVAQLKEDNQLLRRKIENHIIMSEDFKKEYNDWLDSINENTKS